MDSTPLGFPYPECDPPLVKDVSDVGQVRALAEAIDTAVQQVDDNLDRYLVAPLAARMRESSASAWPGGVADPFLDQTLFASPGMGDTLNGGIRITRSGWYLVGMYALVIVASGTFINARPNIRRNGTIIGPYSDPSSLVTATAEDPYMSTTIELAEGDLIQPRISTNNAASFTVTSHLWALLIMET